MTTIVLEVQVDGSEDDVENVLGVLVRSVEAMLELTPIQTVIMSDVVEEGS